MQARRKKLIKFTLLSILIIILTGGFVGYKMWTKPHRDVQAANAIPIAAAQLADAYETDEPFANSRYLDKILEVSGIIDNISKNQNGALVVAVKGTAMSGVICTLGEAAPTTILKGAPISIKGICTGYLADVVLVNCIVQAK